MSKDFVMTVIPVFVAILFVALIGLLMRKSKRGSLKGGEFDERQELLRGKIYRRAFLVTLLLLALYGCVVALYGRPVMEDGVAGLMIGLLGIGFFAVTCVLRGAFFGVRQKPGMYLLISALCVFSSGVGGIGNILGGECVRDGLLTMACLPVVVAAVFLAVLLTIVYQVYLRKEDEET